MKRAVNLLAATALFGFGVAFAAPQSDQPSAPAPATQSEHGYRHRAVDPNRQLKMMTKRLNLTADQQNQILPILTSRQQQMQSILADNSLSPADRHQKMKALRETSNSQIRGLLNNDQQQAFDQMQALQHQRREQKQNSTVS
jgi:Spy/CpxP family protein refolding chaperone